MSKTIDDLRAVLFDTLAAAKDGSLDIERIRAINDVAQTLVNTAKAEIDYLKVTGSAGSQFMNTATDTRLLPGQRASEATGHGSKTVVALEHGATITTHRMRG
jgi:hypothetical protein